MSELSRFAATPRPPDATVRVRSVAEAQFGVITRAQLTECGLSGSTITRWIADRRLLRVYPKVYALGHRRLSTTGELIAALLYAGPGAALSHATAAWWWGLIDHGPEAIHLSAPGRVSSLPAVEIHHPRRLPRTRHRGLPITTVPQTLLDFAADAPPDRLRRAIAEADYRRLLRPEDIDPALGRGHPGSANLRQALNAYLPDLARTASELEQRFLALCERFGIPHPQINVTVAGYKVDALWASQRVIVELDGQGNHSTPAQIMRDHQRDLRLRALGYLVLRYAYDQIVHHPREVAADVLAALTSRPPS